MNEFNMIIQKYLEYCENREKLDPKSIRAYRFDLKQYSAFISDDLYKAAELENLEKYIEYLLKTYKTKTVKRKIASIRALFRYMCYKDLMRENPFYKLQLHFREETVLPKIIPFHTIETLLSFMYQKRDSAVTKFQKITATRDIAVVELLFATGIRISELCSLTIHTVDLIEQTIKIHGKGNKERIIQLENKEVLNILKEYAGYRSKLSIDSPAFFISRNGTGLSEQSVRKMIHKTTRSASIPQNITPHMFRHSFATYLLNANVDIRYIQEILGHSSINVTQIYTHVSMAKQKEILGKNHPRNGMQVTGRD